MAFKTAEEILAIEDRRYETVHVPEWDCDVRVASMTALQRDRWEAAVIRFRGDGGEMNESVRALVVAYCAVDENGEPVFSAEDVERLGKKDGAALDRVFEAAAGLNKLRASDAEEAKGN